MKIVWIIEVIKEGWKTIEMRLLDEKRVSIKLNDAEEIRP